MTRLVNLTPHEITIDCAGERLVLPSEGVARVAQLPREPAGFIEVDGRHVLVAAADRFGGLDGLPGPAEGVLYVVSAIVGAAAKAARWSDVLVPGTGPADDPIRDEQGRIIAIRCLKRP